MRWVVTVDVPNVVCDGGEGVVSMGEPLEAAELDRGLEEDATGRALEMADELDEGVGWW